VSYANSAGLGGTGVAGVAGNGKPGLVVVSW
jgi:hypothetical protein